MANVIDVAAYILERIGNVTTMKLQKLIYYTQVRYLIMNGVPLFENRIEAWANGPVVPDLFRVHSGKYMISHEELILSNHTSALTNTQRLAADKVVDLFGGYSGEQLREMTHSEAPWANARKGYKPDERCHNEITIEAMLDFYTSPICLNPIACQPNEE
ncbi:MULTISPECIES: Panacea domain-containing protein [unclassified Adlercreutzia]|uniref:Panacea domain-containing protein n=1 Tax=unclassified Adlercreutzia TaxID=2636013 RepID=UPI0013EA0FF9|nr:MULTISPECIES: type II toxin-antitoxin system antitoxin SocA domain-containing protein [unclassified Adlercreutzia]